jgi:NitT/TauT family transport system ATP-binding protein
VEPLIRIEHISHLFDAPSSQPVRALSDVSLDVGENELVTLVGRSGCGKSTLLRILAGLLRPTQGDVFVSGERVTRPRPNISLAFQRPALLPWRNVFENVMLPVEVLGLDKAASRAKAQELLELVGLGGFEKRRPYELSGGMQQRAALCRSLIHDPEVLLMDEPFAALDALTREELSLELQRIWSEHRKTIVFVTHSIQEAVLLADRVVVMTPRPGRVAKIVRVGLQRPRSLGDTSEEMTSALAEVHALLFAPDSTFAEQAAPTL